VGNGGYNWVPFKFSSVLPFVDLDIPRPMIGGVLSHSADRWPETLRKIAVFCNHPYFLPCLAAAMVPLGAFFFTSSFLTEVDPLLYTVAGEY
jgi:hypothetical protein